MLAMSPFSREGRHSFREGVILVCIVVLFFLRVAVRAACSLIGTGSERRRQCEARRCRWRTGDIGKLACVAKGVSIVVSNTLLTPCLTAAVLGRAGAGGGHVRRG